MRCRVSRPSIERLISLRFVYCPGPGHELPPIELVRAALQAELPEEGEPYAGSRTYRLLVTDAQGRELERQRVELPPGVPEDLPSCAHDVPIAWRFQSLRLPYDEEGLLRLQLTADGEASVHHSATMLIGPRDDTVFDVIAFDSDYRRHDLEIRMRELGSGTGSAGCV